MDWIIFGFALMTFVSTMIGGIAAIKFRKFLHYFFAFASGTLIAVTFFDILPESLEIAQSLNMPVRYIMITVVASFLFYNFIEKYFLTHHHHDDKQKEHGHIMGPIGASGLIIHSFLDGAAIGTAYQVSAATGLVVALGVIFHDFTDGINTVTLMLKNKHHVKNATIFLFFGAIAPMLGVLFTSLISINQTILAFLLAIFAGEFLYIGTANLLPETQAHTPWKMIMLMILGVILILTLTAII